MKLRLPNWKRFSLRTLFVLMTMFCLVFGTWATFVNPYRLQLPAIATIGKLKGTWQPNPEPGPRWQRWLVTKLLGDDAFVQVVSVDLTNRKVDDKALRSLAGLRFVKSLSLDYTRISDEGLSALRSLPKLTYLSLKYTKISDRGIQSLGAIPQLRQLDLTGAKISDSSVEELAKLKQLKLIYIRWSRISDTGADQLRTALPGCEIYHNALVDEVAAARAN